ncbi:MAG: hypothetical protein M3209_04615 [Acidobacteriota bacterium]|nr:hypothetical protein [Acidobacteriota bacterium]
MAKSIIVSLLTALIMIAFGVFWMFMWLIGTNGFSEKQGGRILALNLVMVIFSVIISSVASGYLSETIQKKAGLSFFIAAPLTILLVIAVVGLVMFIGSIIIAITFGQTR